MAGRGNALLAFRDWLADGGRYGSPTARWVPWVAQHAAPLQGKVVAPAGAL
ncbi:MAG TPA: hypothetical protein VKQ28_01345 [Candidatus Acidoferrum sp.]|nr:hypothetical protein [Candidatus Acidoferrum sp.]